MGAASATNTATKMLIIVVAAAAALAVSTEALLRVPQGSKQSRHGLAGNETLADDTGESAFPFGDDGKHFLSERELREYLDEAMSGRPPPPASHPVSSRPRRSAGDDPVYIYLTPLEESSGPWDEVWTPSPSGCSRRCGGGVLAETRYSVRCY